MTLFLDHTDLDGALAAVQTWANKQDGAGKWITVVKDGAGLSGYLRLDGNGNSWTVGPSTSGTNIAFTLMGDTLILNFYIQNTALTIATAASQIFVRIPDGFTMNQARSYSGFGWMINGGVGQAAVLTNAYSTYIGISKVTFGAYADDSGGAFTVAGQIAVEVTRS